MFNLSSRQMSLRDGQNCIITTGVVALNKKMSQRVLSSVNKFAIVEIGFSLIVSLAIIIVSYENGSSMS